ncbi:MAG: PAS domain-containing protein [Alphaproteobacteria bacterium]|nr:PAS domain-containing protein [Alphaproteobacteria bacterium]
MFFSLSKKILYTLMAFLIFLIVIFFTIFINLYSQKLQDGQNLVYMRNQYVVDLLHENIEMKRKLSDIITDFPVLSEQYYITPMKTTLDETQKELTKEQKLNAELKENYNNNVEAIRTGGKMIGLSLLLVVLLILMLIFLLDHWVIIPIEKLTDISDKVSKGVFSSRIKHNHDGRFKDEFDTLYSAFNQMLDNTEKNIDEIRMREHFLQQLIDAIPDGIRVIDKDYNVIMANQAFYRLFSINSSCVGQKCYLAYGYNCNACPVSRFNCPIQTLKEKNSSDLHAIHDVNKKPLYVSAAKLHFGYSADNYHIVEAIHDLSGDVRFSHQQKISSLGFLSTSLAHEMKNNLGAIRLILEGILESEYKDINDDDERKKYLLMAYKQLVETVKIPERLLKLAQYSETDVSDINVASAVKDMTLMIDYDAKRRGIVVKIQIDNDLTVQMNEADFKMVVLNLTQNAIKAMPDGGELNIYAEKNKRYVILHIQDSGIGIEEEKIAHIFEPFYSANAQVKSSGLGLAIVKSLIEKAKGSISVKSKPGKGTTFTIRFAKKAPRKK